MKIKIPAVVIHIVCCIAFLAIPYFFIPGGSPKLANLKHNPHEQMNILTNLLLIGCFYVSYYVLIPRLFFQRKYILFATGALLMFFYIAILLLYMDRPDLFHTDNRLPGNMPPKPPFGFEISHTLFLFLAILFISLALQLNKRWRKTEKEKLNKEIAYLKAQINPHFLFNTLNSIYSLALEKSDLTADAIARLSALMRYVITDAKKTHVPLEKELTYTQDYIALQKLRLEDTVRIEYDIEGDTRYKEIAPLMLIPFIENAFKYGVNPQEDSLIKIRIQVAETTLHLNVYNKKVQTKLSEELSSGIGIDNTRIRLSHLYSGKHTLHIVDNLTSFEVDLTLKLV